VQETQADLVTVFQNCQLDAFAEGRWSGLVHGFKTHNPHLVKLAEMDWLADPEAAEEGILKLDEDAVEKVKSDLGMELVVSLAKSRVGTTAVAWDPDYLELIDCDTTYSYPGNFHHGYCAPRFWAGPRLRERLVRPLPVPMVEIVTHITPYYAATAAGEVAILNARARRYGGLGSIDGDINHCPVWVEGEPQPDWELVQHFNRASRCLPRRNPDDPWVGNQIVGWTLRDGGMTDVAAYLATKPKREDNGEIDWTMLAPTGKHGLLRVDQSHSTGAWVSALTHYARIDPGPNADHYGFTYVRDLNKIDERELREYK